MVVRNRNGQRFAAIDDIGEPGSAVRVTVLDSLGGQVRLRLEVPAGTCVARREDQERDNNNPAACPPASVAAAGSPSTGGNTQ